METGSSILAWRIPRTGEPGGLLSMGLRRVGHNYSGLTHIARMKFLEYCLPHIKEYVSVSYFDITSVNITPNSYCNRLLKNI